MKFSSAELRLLKIAGIGGLVVATTGMLFRWEMNRRICHTDYFKLATYHAEQSKPLMQLLGEPVNFGRPDVGSNKNYIFSAHEARLEIPMKGSKRNGKLFMNASKVKTSPDDKTGTWQITKLEVEMAEKPNRRAVLVDTKSTNSSQPTDQKV